MSKEKLKIAVLYDLLEEEPQSVPPPPPEKSSKAKGKPRRRKKKEMHDREEIFEALVKLGHEPVYQVVDGRDQSLIALARGDADLYFNLTESYNGDDTMDMNLAAYLDLLGKAYTGASPHALYLAQDKALAKKIFAFHGIRTPFFATSYKGKLDHSHDIAFPLIVKPTSEDGSIGIDNGSVVGSVKELMERIHYIHEEFDSPALIEEYIEGRELYAAVLGNESPEVLPMVELDLSKLPEGTPKIAGKEVKWEKDTEAYRVTKSAVAEDLDEEVVKRLEETALSVYQALKLRDYGRIDMRLTQKGEVYVIEANPNPWLSSGAEFHMAARKAGRTYPQLIGEIVDLARARYIAA
ncbi:MAG TPA: ATP-grasp domain-containing protein [Thermoanaerobaculia bacterium]|nr:ATP-grasp domain-containing protein [Thermoanaerobaculia bacterium]